MSLSKEQTAQLDNLERLLQSDSTLKGQYTRRTALRFLQNRSYDVSKTLSLIKADQTWREQMDIQNLNVSHVQTQLKTGKFVLPTTFDKKGRPIIIFNAGKHDPSTDFLETLKLAVYGFELAIKSMPDDVEEILIIENLEGFTKDNADNRMVKYLLEICQNHYPGRIGQFVAVNAPWYYRLLFKVVKPWLSDDLLSKVNICSDTSTLVDFVDPKNLTTDLGGNYNLNIDDWITERAKKENVDLTNPSSISIAPQIVAAFSDFPTSALLKQCKKSGWMKKQGGYVRKFNKRFCILTDTIFYYYKEENGTKPEGFVELAGATVTPKKGNVFYITTGVNKICIFSTSTSSFQPWITAITNTIQQLTETEDYVLRKVSLGDSNNILLGSLRQSSFVGYDFEDDNVCRFLCKDPHELYKLVKRARMNGEGVKTTNHGEYGDCILGSDLVEWLAESSVTQSESSGKSVGQLLINEYHMFPIHSTSMFDVDALYRFRCNTFRFPLNSLFGAHDPLDEPLGLINNLSSFLNDILTEHFGEKKLVTDEMLLNIRRAPTYKEFTSGIGQLHNTNLDNLSPSETTLFFIQLFNLLRTHTIVAMNEFVDDTVANGSDLGCRFASYIVDNVELSLEDIELLLRGAIPSDDEDRNKFKVAPFDARILFALRPAYFVTEFPHQLNCEGTLEEVLAKAAEKFVTNTLQWNKKTKQILVPEMLKWYSDDFATDPANLMSSLCSFVTNKSWQKTWQKVMSSQPPLVYSPYKRAGFRCMPST